MLDFSPGKARVVLCALTVVPFPQICEGGPPWAIGHGVSALEITARYFYSRPPSSLHHRAFSSSGSFSRRVSPSLV